MLSRVTFTVLQILYSLWRISQNMIGIVRIEIKVLITTMDAASPGSSRYFSVSRMSNPTTAKNDQNAAK